MGGQWLHWSSNNLGGAADQTTKLIQENISNLASRFNGHHLNLAWTSSVADHTSSV